MWLDIGDVADGDDIVVGSNGHQSGGADSGNGVESHVRDSEAGLGGQLGNGWMDWEEQYRRMSLDDRLRLELSSIGLLPGQSVCCEDMNLMLCLLMSKLASVWLEYLTCMCVEV